MELGNLIPIGGKLPESKTCLLSHVARLGNRDCNHEPSDNLSSPSSQLGGELDRQMTRPFTHGSVVSGFLL